MVSWIACMTCLCTLIVNATGVCSALTIFLTLQVLIVGGGDGGVAREVAKHPDVESIDQVEIDAKVIEVSKKHLPSMAVGFSHPKLALHVEDGFKFMQQHEEAFDVVITDSSDPIGKPHLLRKRSDQMTFCSKIFKHYFIIISLCFVRSCCISLSGKLFQSNAPCIATGRYCLFSRRNSLGKCWACWSNFVTLPNHIPSCSLWFCICSHISYGTDWVCSWKFKQGMQSYADKSERVFNQVFSIHESCCRKLISKNQWGLSLMKNLNLCNCATTLQKSIELHSHYPGLHKKCYLLLLTPQIKITILVILLEMCISFESGELLLQTSSKASMSLHSMSGTIF